MATNNKTGNALLNGIRVLDLSQYVPGPYATRLMADLGADVIKLEPPGGEPMRHLMRPEGYVVSPLYTHLNRGKRVLFCDLKSNPGSREFTQLLGDADVLMDGFRPGTLDKLGFGEARRHEINPKLIYCGLSGFGQTGPDLMRAGHDVGYCAAAGLFSYQQRGVAKSDSASTPAIPFPPLADHVGSLQAVNTILAGLVSRDRTGLGCHLDVSLYESILSWYYFSTTPEVVDLLSGGAAYYNIYPTGDHRFVTLGAIEFKFWEAFCTALERPQWVQRHRDPLPQTALKQELNEVFRQRELDHWVELLEQTDCCFEPIPLEHEVLERAQTHSRGLMGQQGFSYPARINHAATVINAPPFSANANQRINWKTV